MVDCFAFAAGVAVRAVLCPVRALRLAYSLGAEAESFGYFDEFFLFAVEAEAAG